MSQSQRYFHLPLADLGITALAGLGSINLNVNGGSVNNVKFIAKSTLGGVAIYTIYQSLLTGFKTEALRKKGLISRESQNKILAKKILFSLKNGATISAYIGLILLFFPWLTLPFAIFGFIGTGKAYVDLFNAFWEGLDPLQRAQLLIASKEAGINLRRFLQKNNYHHGFTH